MKEGLIQSRSEPGQEAGAPRWVGLAVSGQPSGAARARQGLAE